MKYINGKCQRTIDHRVFRQILFIGALTAIITCTTHSMAEVVRDGSVGPDRSTQPIGPNFVIPEDHGKLLGSNLFHSFEKFNLDSSEQATFTGSNSIRNVISRVTGTGASSIDGTIKSTIKSANLYLINPYGIIFGPNASIDIDGSFHASTAESVEFDNGELFEARAGGRIPVLTTAAPVGFGFIGKSAGHIHIDGSELGGLDAINLKAGTIEIRAGAVIGDPSLGLQSSKAVGEITLVAEDGVIIDSAALYGGRASKIFGNTNKGGALSIKASSIEIINGSNIEVDDQSDGRVGIILAAEDRILIEGSELTANSPAPVIDTEFSIIIDAPAIDISMGARVDTNEDISLRAGELLTLSGTSETGVRGVGSSITGSDAVRIDALNVHIKDGGRIVSVNKIALFALEGLKLSGTDGFGSGSSIDASSRSNTSAGSIRIEAAVIRLEDGAQIAARSDLDRFNFQFPLQKLSDPPFIAANPWLNGNRQISVDERNLEETYRSLNIDSTNFSNANLASLGTGDRASIDIIASKSLTLTGTDGRGLGSSIDASARSVVGSASIQIESPLTELRDGARITTRYESPEPDARLDIIGDGTAIFSINIIDIGASSNLSGLSKGGTVVQGDIRLNTDTLTMENSSITTSSTGNNRIAPFAGSIWIAPLSDIEIEASQLARPTIRLKDSEISASASKSAVDGGNITIDSPLVLLDQSRVTAKADSGRGGVIRIRANRIVASQDTIVDASAGSGGIDGRVQFSPLAGIESSTATPLITEYLDITKLMRPPCTAGASHGSFAVAPRRGLPLSPEGPLMAFNASAGSALSSAAVGASTIHLAIPASVGMKGLRGSRIQATDDQPAGASGVGYSDSETGVYRDSLRTLAEVQQTRGEFETSVETLRGALALAEKAQDNTEIASTLGSLGNALLATGHAEQAEQLLTRAIVLARQTDQPKLAAGILNNLGNQQAATEAYEKALSAYMESARIAAESDDRVQEARAISNAARITLQLQQGEKTAELLERAFKKMSNISQSRDRVVIGIHVAKSYAELAAIPEHRKRSLLRASMLLQQAIDSSEKLEDDLNLSYALGNMGALYQAQKRYTEALYMTRRALFAAERADAPESIYRWHWQEGQILWAQGHVDESIAAYRRAVVILEDTHQETLAQYGSASAYFRKTIAPVYLQLVDSLLQAAIKEGDKQRAQVFRIEARATVEQLKAAELRDYFRDECVADLEARTKNIEAVSTTAAVVYPIILPERLELLVSLPAGLEQYSVAVSSRRLAEVAHEFRMQLESRSDVQAASRQLYEWLVQPYASQLNEAGIDTLVFVPDGPLRTIPLAALHDGEQYLINRYGVAVTPGLSLIDPKPMDRQAVKLLLAGLSKSVQGFPALVHVPDELNSVYREYGGQILLDEEFTLDLLKESFENKPPTIVHIASHARFTGDPKSSFLLTYDGRLSMDRLNEYIGTTQYREQPLELLVLSACETAAGDERAALGLAGVGIRAGARSALGSLWSISDEATSELIATFYRQLKDPNVSKAEALRQAQIQLLDGPRFAHPFYWSPFLLINNWL